MVRVRIEADVLDPKAPVRYSLAYSASTSRLI